MRVAVIGIGGSGKTTFAGRLAAQLGVPRSVDGLGRSRLGDGLSDLRADARLDLHALEDSRLRQLVGVPGADLALDARTYDLRQPLSSVGNDSGLCLFSHGGIVPSLRSVGQSEISLQVEC
jgi:hypothetical protein